MTRLLPRLWIAPKARILPLNFVREPKVAADLTEKNTLHARAPLMRTIFADEAVDIVFPI